MVINYSFLGAKAPLELLQVIYSVTKKFQNSKQIARDSTRQSDIARDSPISVDKLR